MLASDQTVAPIDYRVEWAKKHLAKLEQRIEAFMSQEPYKVEKKPDPNTLAYYVTEVPNQPLDIPLMTGDVLFNLRAALDHLAYQLVVTNGTTDENILRNTYFPIFDSVSACANKLKEKTRGMSDAARDAIRDVKPYKGGSDLLWQLQQLNNRDKHRTLITVGSALGFHSLPDKVNQGIIDHLAKAHADNQISDWTDVFGSHSPSDIAKVNVRPSVRKCPLAVGDELKLAFSDPGIHRDSELTFTFEIAFSEPGVIQSEPVVATLKAMADSVENVIAHIKPLFGT